MAKTYYLLTKNDFKVLSANLILKDYGIKLSKLATNHIEIQDPLVANVAAFTAKYEADKLNKTVIRNDSGLYIEALNGFPGSFTAFIDDWFGADGILRLMKDKANRKALFFDAVSFCEPGKKPITFVDFVVGKITSKAYDRKDCKAADKIFIFKGDKLPMAAYSDKENALKFTKEPWLRLGEYLMKNRK